MSGGPGGGAPISVLEKLRTHSRGPRGCLHQQRSLAVSSLAPCIFWFSEEDRIWAALLTVSAQHNRRQNLLLCECGEEVRLFVSLCVGQ